MRHQKTKYLVETSSVLPCLEFSSRPHNAHFKSATTDGELFTSDYVRMEVIRKFVCELIEFATLLELCTTVEDAISFWGEKYGRKPKMLALLEVILRSKTGQGLEGDTKLAAFETASTALDVIRLFDLKLKSHIPNRAGCALGPRSVAPDGRNLVGDLRDFRESFLQGIQCPPINEFLQPNRAGGRAVRLVACPVLGATAKGRELREPLQKIMASGVPVGCRECATVGDQVISMEQPDSWTLIHVDRSFNLLCQCNGKPHKQLRSNASFSPMNSGPKAGSGEPSQGT